MISVQRSEHFLAFVSFTIFVPLNIVAAWTYTVWQAFFFVEYSVLMQKESDLVIS
jgi:hypothetical protein